MQEEVGVLLLTFVGSQRHEGNALDVPTSVTAAHSERTTMIKGEEGGQVQMRIR